MIDVMLDLETMGLENNAAIVAIGAVRFNPHSIGFTDDGFYKRVNLESSVKAGMVMEASAVLWWLKQSSDARFSTFEGEGIVSLVDALHSFSKWVEIAGKDVSIWGNGAMFDNVIIRSAFKAVGLPVPWSFRNDKCYRTVSNLLPKGRQPKFERVGTSHNALDDAITQARHLQKVYKELGL